MGTLIRLLLPLVAAATAIASPIIYIETATADGLLGSSSFSNALVTLTMSGDTLNVVSSTGPYTLIAPLTVSVAGIAGPATFTDTIKVVDNQTGSVGFGDLTSNLAILFTLNPAFSAYTLQSSIGPVSGSALFNPSQPFGTTAGMFEIIAVSGNDVSGVSTFTATVNETTPEPAGFIPIAASLVALASCLIKRRR